MALPPYLTYAAVALGLLITLPLDIRVLPGPIPNDTSPTPASQPLDTASYSRRTLTFPCSRDTCEAWLYLPKAPASRPPPVVVLAHGMGAQKDMGLDRYGERFAAAGLAAFIFDYRTFGGSSGEPRNWVSPSRHLADWRAAVAHVQTGLEGAVDRQQLVLWGSSFAGGHVLVVAAEQGEAVKAVISQVPHLDGVEASRRSVAKRGLFQSLRMVVGGLHDHVRTISRQPAAYLPLVGAPGSLAFMQLDEAEMAAYYSKHPKKYQGGWRNMARSTLVLELSRYSPIRSVPAISAPILFIAATNDSLCPVEVVRKAVDLAAQVELFVEDVTHFDLYSGAAFERAMAEQTSFVLRHTVGEPPAGTPASAGAGEQEGEAEAYASAEEDDEE